MEDGARTQGHGAFNGVLHFTHVSGPVISDQTPHGVFGNGSNRGLRIGKLLEKSGDQNGDIIFAVAQRGQLKLDNIETEIEVLAKGSGSNRGLQVAIGGGDNSNVDAAPLGGAHGFDLALLESP